MPAGKTYIKIASQTLGSNASSVTFSNLPQNYTDLVLVALPVAVSGSPSLRIRFNSDTGSNYSNTKLSGDGNVAGSGRESNISSAYAGDSDLSTTAGASNSITHIMNYSNSTTYKTIIERSNNSAKNVIASVSLWRNTNAITSIELAAGASFPTVNFASGSTFNIYGIECAKSPYAEGGDKVYSTGTHWVHEFYYSGLFVPRQNLTADYLVVAGGGGGGSSYNGACGGGGAGGLRSTVTATGGGGTLESALSLSGSTAYTVTVGAGGGGGVNPNNHDNGSNGSSSSISGSGITTITSTGGGGGAGREKTGQSGGSGGGGGTSSVIAGSGGAQTANQGYAGGNGSTASPYRAGGGGGAGEAGNTDANGEGGDGISSSITGSSVTYAGGGGGGIYLFGAGGGSAGGSGGGGAGSRSVSQDQSTTATAGTTNTGSGGGGGGADQIATGTGAAGGSGIVIVRYAI